MESRLLLDVVIGERSTVLELLSSENESLLVRRNSFFVLDFGLDVVDGIGGLDLEGDGLAGERCEEKIESAIEQKRCGIDDQWREFCRFA